MYGPPAVAAGVMETIESPNSISIAAPVTSLPEHFINAMIYSQVCHTAPIVSLRTHWFRNLLKRGTGLKLEVDFEGRSRYKGMVHYVAAQPVWQISGEASRPVAQSF